ncbi:MAG: GIY-YIG nuclease family protein, partial [Chloroflexi bacterium]
PCRLTVGALGTFTLPQGLYLYLGSARGPGGLAARLAHHRRPPTRPHWHVDYLRVAGARPVAVGWAEGEARRECAWAREALTLPGAEGPIPRFGASDCRCPTHLIFLDAAGEAMRTPQAVLEALARRLDVPLTCLLL